MKLFLFVLGTLYLLLGTVGAVNPTIIDEPETETTQSRQTFIDISSKSYQLALLQIQIGSSKGNLDKIDTDAETSILETMRQAEELSRSDILEILKSSSTKSKTMNDYLQSMEMTLNETTFSLMILQQEVDNRTQEMNNCIAEKKISDQAYFKSINFYEQQGMSESLQKSSLYNNCIAQARLDINAKNVLINKLKIYEQILSKKYSFLSDKKDTIIKNLQVLDTDILKELQSITETINSYDF